MAAAVVATVVAAVVAAAVAAQRTLSDAGMLRLRVIMLMPRVMGVIC